MATTGERTLSPIQAAAIAVAKRRECGNFFGDTVVPCHHLGCECSEMATAALEGAVAAQPSLEPLIEFLREAASYFRNRSTHGEDMTFWANASNAETCEKIAAILATLGEDRDRTAEGSGHRNEVVAELREYEKAYHGLGKGRFSRLMGHAADLLSGKPTETETNKTDRFVSPASPPTPHQQEVATILIEECAEVQQRATKLLRFGPEEVQPGQPHSNVYRLSLEVGDFLEMVDMAVNAGILVIEAIDVGRMNKRRQIAKFMQTEPNTKVAALKEKSWSCGWTGARCLRLNCRRPGPCDGWAGP